MRRKAFEDDHKDFRESARRFVAAELSPHHLEWEKAGIVPREVFTKAGEMGMLAFEVPAEFGGTEVDDFRFNQILAEEVAAAGVTGSGLGMILHNDVCLPYFSHYADAAQKQRWLPGIASGELITAIAMTEPGVGSDLASMQATAVRDGDVYVVNGAKTFITNGINADLVIVAVKTDPTARHRGISLLVIERGAEGFERGRNLDKVGMHAQDTAELFFADVRVPVENLLGEENKGFLYLVSNLPRERLSIAASAVGAAAAALDWTVAYLCDRSAFGGRLADLQTIQFALAEMRTEVELGTVYVDRCVEALNEGELSAEDAAVAKWWCSEMQGRVLDRCVQLHGGYGYMNEYPIARAWADARVTRIYGGTSEIMKGIVGKAMVS
jgi:alkylation response protein AidB-like acyl-CoA dehydrogenase